MRAEVIHLTCHIPMSDRRPARVGLSVRNELPRSDLGSQQRLATDASDAWNSRSHRIVRADLQPSLQPDRLTKCRAFSACCVSAREVIEIPITALIRRDDYRVRCRRFGDSGA